ncbi:MAG: hypothetical protein M1831_006139 [Alyxoria varia]|nr:MAG: hypothetical protein M1831_006139 [Alyxoria varia]
MAAKRDPAEKVTSDDSSGANSPVKRDFEADIPIEDKLRNPLAGLSRQQVLAQVEVFAEEKGLQDEIEELKKGALLAQDSKRFETMRDLTEEDRVLLRREFTHRWRQPFMMYFMTILCAGSAIVQGMDQSSVNGAQGFYFEEFGITNVWQQGLLNGAPYLCSALIGCWTTKPLNYFFGRRGCIFISCVISAIAGVWMAVANTWYNLLIARFALGFAVGAKSSTTPVYAAECAPTLVRGALTMQWQMWTAFGIMLGYIVGVAFQDLSTPEIPYLNWRLMLGSTSIPPLIVCTMVYLCPESPRWYMLKNKYTKAYRALCSFRNSRLQAARDLYHIHASLKVEEQLRHGKPNAVKEFITVPRTRRAAQSSFFVMFMQQFCGVNVVAYYSTEIFKEGGFSVQNALLASLGVGIINWLFALPAVYTIDTFGRRNLLLVTFPLMGCCLLFTGFCFFIDAGNVRLGLIALGIYLFMIVYSPGEGPVPFTYSAEAFPLHIREYGMAFATATTWFFNFVLAMTWPALNAAFTPTGAFGWYAAWNFAAAVTAYFFLPETAKRSLEELDQIFSVRTRTHASYYAKMIPWYYRRWFLRKDEPREPLYDFDASDEGRERRRSSLLSQEARQASVINKDSVKV